MRTTASVGGHPVHMMVVHFPMAFLMGSAAFDVAAAVGLAVPAVVAGYLLVASLATGILQEWSLERPSDGTGTVPQSEQP